MSTVHTTLILYRLDFSCSTLNLLISDSSTNCLLLRLFLQINKTCISKELCKERNMIQDKHTTGTLCIFCDHWWYSISKPLDSLKHTSLLAQFCGSFHYMCPDSRFRHSWHLHVYFILQSNNTVKNDRSTRCMCFAAVWCVYSREITRKQHKRASG